MTDYGQPQTVEAIQLYTEQNSSAGSRIDWSELQKMLDDGEIAHVDGGANGKGGRLSLYGPGPSLQSDAADDQDDDGVESVPAPSAPTA